MEGRELKKYLAGVSIASLAAAGITVATVQGAMSG
ncbi:MAG TPA: SbtA family thio(seleno)oxazole RiPP natural product precursor [bacterium]|jgi:radical SAM modification target selenobiotic family peptide